MKKLKSLKDRESWTKADKAKFGGEIQSTIKNFEAQLTKALEPVRFLEEARVEARKLYELIQGLEDKPLQVMFKAIGNSKPSPHVIALLMLEAEAGIKKIIKEEESELKSVNASNLRKPGLTKKRLEELKEEYQENEFLMHGVHREHGWIKYAIEKLVPEFGHLSYKTIKNTMAGTRIKRKVAKN